MRVAVASDHAGFELKELLKSHMETLGYELVDVGTHSTDPVDYPDFAEKLALAIRDGHAERGVLLCGSGVGANVAANKVPGIRAGICHDPYSAHQGVEHDDIQVLVLGARIIGSEVAKDLVKIFLEAQYTGEDRHARRLAKVIAIEERYRT
ncbi:MAG: ribose 5-phosphate isomerase B [Myxococcota bacterium]